jgi:hypothetical protein
MLQLLQESLPDFEGTSGRVRFRGKIGPGSLGGAAIRGDMDMVRLSLYPPSRNLPSDDDESEEARNGGQERATADRSVMIF